MMNLIALAVSVVVLGVSAWDWWSLRHVRKANRQAKNYPWRLY